MPLKQPQPSTSSHASTLSATLGREDYKYLSDLIMRQSGLQLGDGKEYLLTSRLESLAKSLGLQTVSEMATKMRAGKIAGQERLVAEALATHETLFFRDPDSFAFLRRWLVGTLAPARQAGEKIRIWSAACSSGQEAYSLMIMMEELVAQCIIRGPVEIVASDFSKAVVERASAGVFTGFEVGRGLTSSQRDQFFSSIGHDRWQVRDRYRAKIQFENRNLLDGLGSLGKFDLVLCRNVMIYFELSTKADLLRRMVNVLAKDGILVLGASESVSNLVDCYDTLATARASFLKRR